MELLYRVDDRREVLVIPAVGGLRQLLLAELHDSLMAGHFGVRRTLRALKGRAWWPGIAKDVQSYVQACPVCQRTKDST